MSDINEEQKRLYKRAEENDYIVKDIAQYEENDSKLAKYTILELQKQLDFMIDRNNEKQNRIDKAVEYINEMCLCSEGYANYGDDLRPEHIVNILKGDNK